jgi:hypothetical protein
MKRRDMNRILMLGTALAGGWPPWLRRAFGVEGASGPADGALRWRRIAGTAYRRAVRAGKPLLALVVPVVDPASGRGYQALWDRGQAFGELLNHGDDDALATLALAEVVCAPAATLQELVPALPAGEPLMVLIETDGVLARARPLDHPLPRPSRPEARGPVAPEDWESHFARQAQAESAAIHRRIAVLTRLLHEGLRATPQMLLDRAARARAGLGRPPGPASLTEAHGMAAVLLAAAVALPERERGPAIHRIAEAARTALCRHWVPGSRWANASGCGARPELEPDEKDESVGIRCGMGHVPDESRRFLDFLTRDATWRSRS